MAVHFGCFDTIGSVVIDWPVNVFLEDGFRLDRLELGLEIGQTAAAAVRVATGIVEIILVVLNFVAGPAPG